MDKIFSVINGVGYFLETPCKIVKFKDVQCGRHQCMMSVVGLDGICDVDIPMIIDSFEYSSVKDGTIELSDFRLKFRLPCDDKYFEEVKKELSSVGIKAHSTGFYELYVNCLMNDEEDNIITFMNNNFKESPVTQPNTLTYENDYFTAIIDKNTRKFVIYNTYIRITGYFDETFNRVVNVYTVPEEISYDSTIELSRYSSYMDSLVKLLDKINVSIGITGCNGTFLVYEANIGRSKGINIFGKDKKWIDKVKEIYNSKEFSITITAENNDKIIITKDNLKDNIKSLNYAINKRLDTIRKTLEDDGYEIHGIDGVVFTAISDLKISYKSNEEVDAEYKYVKRLNNGSKVVNERITWNLDDISKCLFSDTTSRLFVSYYFN